MNAPILEHCFDLYNSSSYSSLLTYLTAHKSELDQTADFWALLGLTRKSLGFSIETVLSAYYQGLSIDSKRADLHFNIGNSLTAHDIGKCSYHYLEAIKLCPFESSYWHNYYSFTINHDLTSETTIPFCLHQAILLNPQNPAYLSDFGLYLLSRSKLEAAVRAFEFVITYHPSFLPAYVNLANCYIDNNQSLFAAKVIDLGLVKHPTSQHLLLLKSLCCLSSGDYENGWQLFDNRLNSGLISHPILPSNNLLVSSLTQILDSPSIPPVSI